MRIDTAQLRRSPRILFIAVTATLVLALCLAAAPKLFAPPLAYRFEVGSRTTSSFHYSGDGHSDIRPLLNGKTDKDSKTGAETNASLVTDLKFQIDGNMVGTVVDQTPTGYLLAIHWDADRATALLNGQDQPTLADTLRHDLAQDVSVEIDRQGHIGNLRFPVTMGVPAQSAARMLLSLTQCVLPKNGSDASWETNETDPNGNSVVHYAPKSKNQTDSNPKAAYADTLALHKSIVKYLPDTDKPVTGELPVQRDVRTEGGTDIHFDTHANRVATIDVATTQTTRVADKVIAVNHTSMTAQFTSETTISQAQRDDLRTAMATYGAETTLASRRTHAEQEQAVETRALGDSDSATILVQLDKLEQNDSQNTTDLYLKLKALVSVKPEICATLAKRLITAKSTGPSFRLIIAALEAVSSPEAQHAVVTAIQARSSDAPALQQFIPALGVATDPLPQAQQALEGLVDHGPTSVASTAQLALGTMAYHLADPAPERANQIVQKAIDRIQREQSRSVRQRLLLTLGNSGNPLALPTLTGYLNNPESELRGTATYALRFVPNDKSDSVDTLLIKMLTTDAEPFVRSQAAIALYFRTITPALFAAEAAQYAKEKDAHVRTSLLTDLWKVHDTFPDATRIVNQAAMDDPAPDVRRAALDLVNPTPAKPN